MSLVFATMFFLLLFFFNLGGGGGVLRHSAVQTDFEFEISGPLPSPVVYLFFKINWRNTHSEGVSALSI